MTIALLVAPVSAAAQSSAPLPQLEAATRVRVWSASDTDALKARVQISTPQSLEVAANDGSRVFQVSELDRVDVSRGRSRGRWMLGGILVGGTAGVLIARADNNDNEQLVDSLGDSAAGLANTLAGMLVGGVVGYFVAPERWRTVWQR